VTGMVVRQHLHCVTVTTIAAPENSADLARTSSCLTGIQRQIDE
jgi:hypothetical protein